MLSEMISYSTIDTFLGEVFLKGIPVTYCLANFRERNDQQYTANEWKSQANPKHPDNNKSITLILYPKQPNIDSVLHCLLDSLTEVSNNYLTFK